MDKKQRASYLLEKYISNSCTQQEFDEFMELIKASGDFDDFDDSMKAHWLNSKQDTISETADWEKIHRNIKLRLWALKKTKLRFRYAAFVVLLMASLALILFKKPATTDHTLYMSQHSAAAKTKVILLSDGTKVTLNSNSNLHYPQVFNDKTREVYLEGEAYFQVVHDINKPFIIHSGKLKTQVLGTAFTISAYSQIMPITVTVLTGKVAVKDESTNAKAVLTRGQSATTQEGKNTFELTRVSNPEDAIAWIEDKIIFENSDLETVALKLSNKYGVTVKIADKKLSRQHITAIFQGQSLVGILNAITKLTHTNYIVNKNIYTLY